jgi:DNA-directed RNA polymerase specialized sigma24 family protein
VTTDLVRVRRRSPRVETPEQNTWRLWAWQKRVRVSGSGRVAVPVPWWVLQLQRAPAAYLLVLYGIDNPVAFVAHALADEVRYRGATLPGDTRDRAMSHLNEVLCKLAKRYDPSRSSLSLSTYAYGILRRRYTDWLRGARGDSRYGNDGREEPSVDAETLSLGELDPVTFKSLVESIDHDQLSTRARETLRRICWMMNVYGYNATEAAESLGKTRREVASDLQRLRQELAAA